MSGRKLRRDGETEPCQHAVRVVAHRHVDEVGELRELDDRRQMLGDEALGVAEESGVQENVLATGEIEVEARSELQQRCGAAPHHHSPLSRSQDPRDHLQQGALAGTVAADQPYGLTGLDGQIDSLERPELAV